MQLLVSHIKEISLTQFRNYSHATFHLDARVVCITGQNGVGKTNLLDAVYFLCYTKSYFTGYQQQLVQFGTEGFRVEGVFENDGMDEKVNCKWKNGKKEIHQNDILCEQLRDYIGKHTAVMIAPDDIELINEGSEVRRKWVDGILAQSDKSYFDSLMKYQQALLQRNAWLKANAVKAFQSFAQLEFYDKILIAAGDYIFRARVAFLNTFLPLFETYYATLSDHAESIAIDYQSQLQQSSMEILLRDSLANDLLLQRTLKGVHKDDFIFNINQNQLKQFGSQGQKKSYLFALKLAQYQYLKKKTGNTPIILLDDVFEKLDSKRLNALWQIVLSNDFGQVLITDTEVNRLKQVAMLDASIKYVSI